MRTLKFVLRSAGLFAVLVGPLGLLASGFNAGLLAAIHRAVTETPLERAALWSFFGFGAGRVAATYVSTTLLGNSAAQSVTNLRRDILRRLLGAPYRVIERVGPGRLHAALSYDVAMLEGALSSLPSGVSSAAVLLGGAAYLAYLDAHVFGLALLVAIPCAILFRLAARYADAAFLRQHEAYERLFEHFRTLTDGAKELKLHAARRDAFLEGPVRETTQALLDHDVEVRNRYARAGALNHAIVLGVLGLLLFALPEGSALRTQIGSGYVLVGLYLISPLAALSRLWPVFRSAEVALDNLDQLGVKLTSAEDEPRADPSARPNASRIELRAVSFRYDDERAFTLGPLSLALERGEVVFVTGGNGSGKTTLARLLTALYTPDGGELRWDDAAVARDNRDLYRQLWSAVFYDAPLFDRLYGVAPSELPRARELLVRLGLAEVVQLQGDRFSTLELSAGQRKRLALLLALLDDRPFYMFDEWAAEQEPDWKRVFYDELLPELRARGKGVVVITHDDRFFERADRLVHLRDGQLAAAQPRS